MASVVTIQIRVDDAQAQQSLQNIEDALKSAGVNGSASIKQLGSSLQDTDKHITTSLDGVRLFSQEFGLRLPRAMESMLARIPAVESGLRSLVGVFAAIAAAEVIYRAGEAVYDLGKKWFDVNAAVREYAEKAGTAASQKLIDESSLETAVSLVTQLTQQIDGLEARKRAEGVTDNWFGNASRYIGRLGLGQVPGVNTSGFNSDDGKNLASDMEARDKAVEHSDSLQHEMKMRELQDNEAIDSARLRGIAAVNQKLEDQNALARATFAYTQNHEFDLYNQSSNARAAQLQSGMKLNDPKLTPLHMPSAQAGGAEYQETIRKNDEEAAAERIKLAQSVSLAEMRAQDEAVQAGLRGEALFEAQRRDGIQELTKELQNQGATADEIAARSASLALKYDNDHSQRLKEQMRLADEALMRAQSVGLTGVPQLNAEHAATIFGINSDPNKSDAEKSKLQKVADTDLTQRRAEISQQYADRVKQMEDDVAQSAVQGYARIALAAQKATDDEMREFNRKFVDEKGQYKGSEEDARVHQAALTSIQDKATSDRIQLEQKGDQMVAQYDEQAAAAQARVRSSRGGGSFLGWPAEYQDAIQKIDALADAHTAKVKADLQARVIDERQAALMIADINKEKFSEIEEQNLQLRDRIAGDLQSAFQDPVSFIKNAMQKMMFDIIANWITGLDSFKRIFGETMSSAPGTGGGAGGGAGAGAGAGAGSGSTGGGGLLGSLFGHKSTSTPAGVGRPSLTSGAASFTRGASPSGDFLGGGSTLDYASTAAPSFTSSPSTMPAGLVGGGSVSSSTPPIAHGPDVASLAQSGLGDYSTLSSAWGQHTAATAPAGTTDINSIPQVPFETNPDMGSSSTTAAVGMTHGQMAVAGVGAGMAGFAGVEGIWGGIKEAGGSPGNVAKGIGSATLSGLGAGAAIGSLFGPAGTVIGAAIGAGIGFITSGVGAIMGESGRLQARKYFHDQLDPQIQQDVTEFRTGGGDFQSAIAGINKTASDGMIYVAKNYGNSAAQYMMSTYLSGDVSKADAEITRLAKAGSAGLKMSAAQFHDGGPITGFGSLATTSTEGFIHAMLGETVMNPGATMAHAPALGMMNDGADASEMAAHYLSMAAPRGSSAGGSGGGDTHYHIHTMDTKTMTGWLKGGGAKMIDGALNNFRGDYAGVGKN